ncbi:MAG: hypothetical protein V3T58_04760 [Candidatus Hydrothermarchaeales archaeon]
MRKVALYSLISIVILGIYVLPSVTARFAGSHTVEMSSDGMANMSCGICHNYIAGEINLSFGSPSDNVFTAHKLAYENDNYTNYLNIDNAPSPVTTDNICMLCHQLNLTIEGTHTMVTVRVCTDNRCHGGNTTGNAEGWNQTGNTSGDNAIPSGAEVGPKLTVGSEAHSGWFDALEGYNNTNYYREDDTAYTAGFYACMGCHTHVGVNIGITRSTATTYTIQINPDGSLNVSEPSVTGFNTTDLNKTAGVSVWT